MIAEFTSSGVGFSLQPDPWLGGIIGRPAMRLSRDFGASQAWIKKLRSDRIFVTAKVDARDIAVTSRLEDLGFRMVDAALTFEAAKNTTNIDTGTVRFATPSDRSKVASIASSSFVYSRFHLDPAFPDSLGRQIKFEWADNFFVGKRGDCMIVAEDQGSVVGFCLLISTPNALVIDLVAVSATATRKGLARAMIEFAFARAPRNSEGRFCLRAGTQAANLPSVRMYESLGFCLTSAQFVLHHHGSGGAYREGILP